MITSIYLILDNITQAQRLVKGNFDASFFWGVTSEKFPNIPIFWVRFPKVRNKIFSEHDLNRTFGRKLFPIKTERRISMLNKFIQKKIN